MRPRILIVEDEAALLGAAILAGVGAGLFDTIDEGVDRMVSTSDKYVPDNEDAERYDAILQDFLSLYAKLHP